MLMGRPNTKPDGVALARYRKQARRIGLESIALDGLDPGREPAVGIGYGDPDGLGAEIETDQRATFRPVGGGVDQGEE